MGCAPGGGDSSFPPHTPVEEEEREREREGKREPGCCGLKALRLSTQQFLHLGGCQSHEQFAAPECFCLAEGAPMA